MYDTRKGGGKLCLILFQSRSNQLALIKTHTLVIIINPFVITLCTTGMKISAIVLKTLFLQEHRYAIPLSYERIYNCCVLRRS